MRLVKICCKGPRPQCFSSIHGQIRLGDSLNCLDSSSYLGLESLSGEAWGGGLPPVGRTGVSFSPLALRDQGHGQGNGVPCSLWASSPALLVCPLQPGLGWDARHLLIPSASSSCLYGTWMPGPGVTWGRACAGWGWGGGRVLITPKPPHMGYVVSRRTQARGR